MPPSSALKRIFASKKLWHANSDWPAKFKINIYCYSPQKKLSADALFSEIDCHSETISLITVLLTNINLEIQKRSSYLRQRDLNL